MLHHRHRRLVEISYNSQPMTSILDIRGRRTILSPLDPFHISNSSLGRLGPVQCGLLVRVGPIPQSTILTTDPPLNLGILEHLSPEFYSETLWKVLFQSGPVDSANLLLAHRA